MTGSSAMPFKTGLVYTLDCGEFGRALDPVITRFARPLYGGYGKRPMGRQLRETRPQFPLEIASGTSVAGLTRASAW